MALRVHREPGIEAPHPTPAQILRMATERGADTTPFAGRIGRLSAGRDADVVLFDWDTVTYPYQSPDIPPVDVLVQRAKSSSVKTVFVAGEAVYRDGRFVHVDKQAVLAEIAARFALPLTEAEIERRQLARDVFPHVRKFYDFYLDGLGDEPFYRPSGRF
jgi:cytosine/adenosine deaminase-related metal-dependent hydrolase